MLAVADPDLDHGPRTDKSATMRMCAVSREVRPIDELIRFVVSPHGRGGSGSEAQASRPGPVGFGLAPERLRKRSGVTNLAGVSSATSASRRPFPPIPKTCWFAARSRRWRWPPRRARWFPVLRKVEGALQREQIAALIHASDGAADGIRKLDAIARQRGGNRGESPGIPDRHCVDVGRIGFGTGPVKCDTCCPARGPGEQDVPVAQPDAGPIPDGRRRQDRRGGQKF